MLSALLQDQEVQGHITNFEVDYDGATNIKLELNPAVDSPVFYLNDRLITPKPSTAYEFETVKSYLKLNEENTLTVTNSNKTFSETRTFTCKDLVPPTAVTIASTNTNTAGQINASNVNNATILVTFPANSQGGVPVTLTVKLTGKDADGNTKVLTLSRELAGTETEVRFDNLDLSAFAEGTLSLYAEVEDNQGNVDNLTNATITKRAEVPMLKDISIERSVATSAKITLYQQGDVNEVYYVVKKSGEAAPSVEQVLNGTKVAKASITSNVLNVEIEDGVVDESYVAYLVANTTTGTKSELLSVKIAKVSATKIAKVADKDFRQVSGVGAKVEWDYTETEPGFDHYLVLLTNNGGTVLDYKEVAKGAERIVDFTESMKKQPTATYKVKVIAVADNVEHFNSDNSKEITITLPGVITRLDASWDSSKDTLLRWTPVGDVSEVASYTVKVEKYNKDSANTDKYDLVTSFTLDDSKYAYDVESVMNENGIGSYRFTVTANAKDDVFKANVKAIAVKYHLGAAITNLSVSKVDGKNITLNGTLLVADKFENGSSAITYELYAKQATVKDYTTDDKVGNFNSIGQSKLPYAYVASADATTYTFKLVTKIDGHEYVSNEVSATTEAAPINISSSLTYVEYKETSNSAITGPVINFSSENNAITYKDNTLYINDSSTQKTYTASSVSAVNDIIAVLKQMSYNDKIKITNNEVKELALEVPVVGKTYRLGTNATKAEVTMTSNSSADVTKTTAVLSGEVASLKLDDTTVKAKYDLSGLTVTGNVIVKAQQSVLIVGNVNKLDLTTNSITKITVNDVVFEESAKIPNLVAKNGNEFTFECANSTVKVDASKAKANVKLNVADDGSQHALTQLDITASNDYTFKLNTNTLTVTALNILAGKVDLRDAKFGSLKLGKTSGASEVQVVSVTLDDVLEQKEVGQGLAENNLADSATTLIDGSKFQFVASAASKVTYSTIKGSSEITFRIATDADVTVTKQS